MALLSPATTTLAIDSCYLDIFLSTLCLHMLSFLHGMHFLFVPLMLIYIYIYKTLTHTLTSWTFFSAGLSGALLLCSHNALDMSLTLHLPSIFI